VKSTELAVDGRFAVIGCGSIGKRHIKNLALLGARDIVAFDTAAERRDEAGKLGALTVDNLDALWVRRPTVFLITVPTSLHLALAREAAQRGCHLFIEKPLSHNWDGVEALLDEVRRRDLITLVGCNTRFHPGLSAVKNLLGQQAIGRVMSARVEVGQYLPDWHPYEDYRKGYSARRDLGGGIILDAIHEIDYIRWLLGEITGVTRVAEKLSELEIDTEDMAALILKFESGAVGELHLDYLQRAYSRTCQLIGAEGTIHWDYWAGLVRWYCASERRWQHIPNPADWQPNQMYLDEMQHYLRCLTRQESPALDVFDGARDLAIALAAKTAARERSWIDLKGVCHGS